jgi:hypothetical protein
MQLGFLKPTEQEKESVLSQIKAIKEKALSLEADMKSLNEHLESKGLAISGPNVIRYRQMFDGIGAAAWQISVIRIKCQIKSRIIELGWF